MTTLAMPKARRDSGIEGVMAKWYAANTAEMMNQYIELAQRVARELPAGSRVLEVAPGPGYFCMELAKLGAYRITGLDISRTFVKMAAKRADEAGLKIEFVEGSASNLPFPQGSFDFVLCRAAFKNFANPVGALEEMRRVISPEGRALIIDLRGGASRAEVSEAVDQMGLTKVNRIVTRAIFKSFLLKRAYTRVQFEQMLAKAGVERYEIAESGVGFEISVRK